MPPVPCIGGLFAIFFLEDTLLVGVRLCSQEHGFPEVTAATGRTVNPCPASLFGVRTSVAHPESWHWAVTSTLPWALSATIHVTAASALKAANDTSSMVLAPKLDLFPVPPLPITNLFIFSSSNHSPNILLVRSRLIALS